MQLFLNLVHMYKRVLGKKGFPPGRFEWYPLAWASAYFQRKRRQAGDEHEREGTSTAHIGGSSSSAGSSAPSAASARPTLKVGPVVVDTHATPQPAKRRICTKRSADEERSSAAVGGAEPPAKKSRLPGNSSTCPPAVSVEIPSALTLVSK